MNRSAFTGKRGQAKERGVAIVQNKFTAVDDDGNRHTIYFMQGRLDVSDTHVSGLPTDGPEALRTSDGRTVVRIHQGAYEIFCGGDRIRVISTDANAP